MMAGNLLAQTHPFRKRIVIGGPPRTGSSLLRVLLDASPTIMALAETAFFVESLEYRQKRLARSATRLNRVLGLDEGLVGEILASSTDQIECFDRLIAAYQTETGIEKPVWAEKTPRNCLRYPELRVLDPQLYVLSIIRDGRDVVTSVVDPDKGYHCSIERYCAAMQAVFSFRDARHRILRYEDLVRDPEACLRSLFGFLGEDFDPALLTAYRQPSPTRGSQLMRQENVKKPISARSIGRWRGSEHRARVMAFAANAEAGEWNARAGYGDPVAD